MQMIVIFITVFVSTLLATEGLANMYDPKDNEVFLGHGCIEMPLQRILLIRKDAHYCAIKFIKYWTEQEGKNKYAEYETYYQKDGSGDFSKGVSTRKDIASAFPLKGPFRPFIYQPGISYIKCDSIKLTWEYKKAVCFSPPDKGRGDFGFELAPTIWTDISQIDITDPRIKWYKDDEKRERAFIQIDKLWNDKKQ